MKRHWHAIFAVSYGTFVLLPFIAPVLMHWSMTDLGRMIYLAYGFVCHQLPERSLFLFGPRWMYSLEEIRALWPIGANPLVLRQFIGDAAFGWKVAWSDRMISAYGGVWIFGLLWGSLRTRARPISTWIFLLMALPMALDGATHFLSDLDGLTGGFRYTNAWLVGLTGNAFPESFYAGDGLGSFNSWMRWLSGLLFSFGIVWWSFPYLQQAFGETGRIPAAHRL